MKYNVHLPRLCSRSNLSEICRLHPTALSITENADPISTGSMQVPVGEPVTVGQFVEVYDAYGSLGYYRVASVTRSIKHYDLQDVRLEHAISTLGNDVIFGEIDHDGSHTDKAVLGSLLNKQTKKYWKYGGATENMDDYLAGRSDSFYFENEDLLDAVLDWQAVVPAETYLAYDFTEFPWSVCPHAMWNAPTMEARLNRNIDSLQITKDWSRLCTRIYPTGGSNGEETITIKDAAQNTEHLLYIDADTKADWGVIAQVWSDTTAASADALYAKALKRLEKVKNPGVTIVIDGRDLSAVTGESIDRFKVNQLCRVALPEENESYTYRVLSVLHPDLIGAPAKVTVTLGTMERRTASRTRRPQEQQEEESGGRRSGGGGGSARQVTASATLTFSLTEGTGWSVSRTLTLSSEWTRITAITGTFTPSNTVDGYSASVNGVLVFSNRTGQQTVSLLGYMTSGGVATRSTHTFSVGKYEMVNDMTVTLRVDIKGYK